MVEAGAQRADKRIPCPDCGSRSVELQRMGVDLFVVCDGDCQDNILGVVDPWHDALSLNDSKDGGGDGG